MRKRKEAVAVRVDADAHKYLQLLALAYGQSITGALASMAHEAEHANPIEFRIVRVIADDGEQYEVTVNGGQTIADGPTMEAALAGLTTFRNEHGCTDYRRFKLEKEVEVADFRFAPSRLPDFETMVSQFKAEASEL